MHMVEHQQTQDEAKGTLNTNIGMYDTQGINQYIGIQGQLGATPIHMHNMGAEHCMQQLIKIPGKGRQH